MSAGRPRSLELITPSYAPDFELCCDLVSSVTKFAPTGTVHRVLVPRRDLALFASLHSHGDVIVQPVDDFIPASLKKVPGANVWMNLRNPWPPVRGWIVQQIIKLAAAAAAQTEGVLLVDSDLVFVRDFTWYDFGTDSETTLYRLPGAIHPGMEKHLVWDRVARALLGVEATTGEAPADYIAWPCLWSPVLVRSLLEVVEARSGRPWATVIGSQLHFSEMVLYGIYVGELLAGSRDVDQRASMACRLHSEERPLAPDEIDGLLDTMTEDQVAVMISAKSGTLLQDRRDALRRYWAKSP